MSLGNAYDTKEQIRQAIDIVDLVGSYLELRRAGRGYVARCPWHDDTRPSLQVNPDRQSWKCWVCDIGGDVFSFVMQHEKLDFREALEMLADRAGIELRPQKSAPIVPGSPDDKGMLYRALAWAEQQFSDCLHRSAEGEPARNYLKERGITSESAKRFHMGFAPNVFTWLLDRARGTPFSPAVLKAAGVARQHEETNKHYDFFRGRVMFSIRDLQSRPIAFGGRILPEFAAEEEKRLGRPPGKYFNGPETRLFSKSENLYGFDLAREAAVKSKEIVVMEGYTDVVMADQAGLNNAAAVLGTALGEKHIKLLKRFVETIVLVLDGDEAGQNRTNDILELFVAEQVDLRILTLPDGLDPCDFLLRQGAEPFRELLRTQAVDALEHKLRVATRGVNVNDTHAATRALEEVLGTLAKAPRLQDGTSTANRLREQQVLARLARTFRVAESELRDRLHDLRRKTKSTGTPRTASPDAAPPIPLAIDPLEVELIEILCLHSEMIGAALEVLSPTSLKSAAARAIYETFEKIHEAGEPLEFASVLTALDEPRLKNLLVQIDERASEKASRVAVDPAARLAGIARDFERLAGEAERREKVAALEEKQFQGIEELSVLQQLMEQERKRQGISAPTEG